MKKFLSLVLAVIMTMSLVTISASAAEYKDFTDKDEIQYEEAVAVLNKLGIITGYSEGDFRPEGELTRGAAAKIIASLLLGPAAAENLSPTSAPFKDVPLDHTFAGPIAYCSTLKIINGYSDGSFQPGGTLTGYAFSKMLLGALGYDGAIEGFTGAGWNMNVNSIGANAGLFDRLDFKGNDAVNREEAAQLALNTLKATMVEYKGGMTITAGDAHVVSPADRTYKTSNNRDYALNISSKSVEDGWWTVEFGEEHFVDLRLEHDKYLPTPNDMGDPSAEWSYKKVTIGTYALEPDFSYDKQVAHLDDTAAAKTRALNLNGYEVDSKTSVWLNGYETSGLKSVDQIADYTDNGTLVRVYVSETKSDYITDVVVEKTQLMEVKRVGSDYVSLQMYDNGTSDDKGTTVYSGFNQSAINKAVENVQPEDDTYTFLSGLKTGDVVAVVPVSADHGNSKYEVSKAYTPETVTGTLTGSRTYGKTNSEAKAISVTVGGSTYNVALWNKDLAGINDESIKVTRKDVTLYLDVLGNAMLAKDVGATNDWMVIGNFRQSLDNGRLVWIVNGWDISGTELSLNLGPNFSKSEYNLQPGDLVKYTSKTNSNVTDWELNLEGVYNVYAGPDSANNNAPYEIKASNVYVQLKGYDTTTKAPVAAENDKEYLDKSVKFVYVRFDTDGEVESVEVKTGAQNVKNNEILTTGKGVVEYSASTTENWTQKSGYDMAQAAVKVKSTLSESSVKAVVIKSESSNATASNMLYIRDYLADFQKNDANGKIVYGYLASMMTPNGFDDNVQIYSERRLERGDFASYVLGENATFSPFYDLRKQNDQVNRTTASIRATYDGVVSANAGLIRVKDYKTVQGGTLPQSTLDELQIKETLGTTLGIGNEANVLNVSKAEWLDLSGNKIVEINSTDDLKQFASADVSLIFNDNPSTDGFRTVSLIVINSVGNQVNGGGQTTDVNLGEVGGDYDVTDRGAVTVYATLDRPDWAASDAKLKGSPMIQVYANGAPLGSAVNVTNVTPGSDGVVRQTVSIRNENVSTTEKITWEFTGIEWDKAKLEVNGAPSDFAWADGTSLTSIDITSGATLKFTPATNKYYKVDVTISGAKISGQTTAVLPSGWTDSTGYAAMSGEQSIAIAGAAQGQKVVVTLDAKTIPTTNVKTATSLGSDAQNLYGVNSQTTADAAKEEVQKKINELAPKGGVYSLPQQKITGNAYAGDSIFGSGEATPGAVFFPYVRVPGEKVTLTVTDSAGEVAYSQYIETTSGSNATGYFWVQLVKVNSTAHNDETNASGYLKGNFTDAVPTGKLTYTIIGSRSGLIGSGSFNAPVVTVAPVSAD